MRTPWGNSDKVAAPTSRSTAKRRESRGGRMGQCLNEHSASISPGCKASCRQISRCYKNPGAGARRRDANLAAPILSGRFCPGRRGRRRQSDGMLLQGEGPLQRGVPESGRRCGLRGNDRRDAPRRRQVKLSSGDLINSLQGVEQAGTALTAARLRQMALQSLSDPTRASRMNRAPLTDELEKLAQLTSRSSSILVGANSPRFIPGRRPDGGLALSPVSAGLPVSGRRPYRRQGSREYNLKLSQQRAERHPRSPDQSLRHRRRPDRIGRARARSNCLSPPIRKRRRTAGCS